MIDRNQPPARRSGQRRGGATAVEMAFVIPVLLMLLLGIMDFATVVYAYGTVSEAARCGALVE